MPQGPGGHTIKAFDQEIDQLRTLISQMGGIAEVQIATAIDALMQRDGDAARMVVEQDKELDRLEAEAERQVITMIALRAPMADDLREAIAALKISAVIERIGDYAKNIARRVAVVSKEAPVGPLVIIPEMARAASAMVHDALDSYIERDATLAREVLKRDRQVDDFYNSLFRSLLTYMMENPHHITPSAHVLFIAKNLERIGDHATNIAEMVHYSVTGDYIGDRPRGDSSAIFGSTGAKS
ncbi:MAG: phosphate signaling complex protein PhoU [Sphingomonadaceae bacterium]